MIENEQQDGDLENTEEVVVVAEEESEATEDIKAPEPSERERELEAELAKTRRQLKRLSRKDEPEEKHTDKTPGDLDYGQKAFLRSYDIKTADEQSLVRDWMRRTGDTLDAVVEDEIFQARLGKLREARAAADAIPKGVKRGSAPATDDVAYWQTKIESGAAQLTDIPDINVRRKVLNARIENERIGGRFSDQPVQMG